MPIDEYRFRQAMGHFATGVTVVTTAHGGHLYGMTVSSFASLSLKPPLVLICIEKLLATQTAIAEAGQFAVNVLEQGQEHLSRRFATRENDKFMGVAWDTSRFGLPVLEGALAIIECQLRDTFPGGDHTIFVGEVMDAEINQGSPLLYYRRGYHELA
jgi:4-nitrophenol 2-monooxygenase / 4-nitrocatechol 4-monooxygenase, reductase component